MIVSHPILRKAEYRKCQALDSVRAVVCRYKIEHVAWLVNNGVVVQG